MTPQIEQMRALPGSFDGGAGGNLRYTLDPGGGHDMRSMLKQFYNSAQLFF